MKAPADLSMKTASAAQMLLGGFVLSALNMYMEPLGKVDDSVLWYLSQVLIYAGAVFGVDAAIDWKLNRRTPSDPDSDSTLRSDS